jgi:hypothetical protein
MYGMSMVNQPPPKVPTDQAREKKIQKCIKMIKFHERKGNKKKTDYWTKRLDSLNEYR